jgi:hypothetical protein
MSYRDVVPPEQPQYRIEGHQLASTNINLAPISSSEASLQLKPDRSAHAQQPQTPSRTEGSEQESLRQHLREAEARATEQQRQAAKQAELKGHVRDALDDAIEEAKTVRDLVSKHSLVMATVPF